MSIYETWVSCKTCQHKARFCGDQLNKSKAALISRYCFNTTMSADVFQSLGSTSGLLVQFALLNSGIKL